MVKKIVQITNGHGGELEVVKRLKNFFDKKEITNTVLSFKELPSFEYIPVHWIFDENIPLDFKKMKTLTKDADIVLCHNIFNVSSILVLFFLSCLCRKKVISVIHSNLDGKPMFLHRFFYFVRRLFIVNSVFLFSQKVVFLTKDQKKKLFKMVFFKRSFLKKVKIINNFINSEWIVSKPPIVKRDFDLIFVGRLSYLKGFGDLLKIKSLMEEISLIVIGDGVLKKEIPQKDNILFIEKVENKEMKKFYDKAKILILPSYTEVFPLTILEAMARGLVILASNIGGIKEIVKEGENGYLFNPGDTKGVMNLISYLQNNPLEVSRISKNNLKFVKNFTVEKQGLKYVKLFENILKERMA